MYATTRFLSMWMWCFIYGMLMFVFIPANDITIGIRFMTDKKSTISGSENSVFLRGKMKTDFHSVKPMWEQIKNMCLVF